MNILTPVVAFLFFISAFLCLVVYVGRNEALYRRFFTWWLNLWGVPAAMQQHIPIEMQVKQARNFSWIFGFLALITFCAGFYIMLLIK